MALLVHHPPRRGTLQGLPGRLGHSRVLKVVEGTEKAFPAQVQLKEVTQSFCPHEPPPGCPQQRPEAHVLIDKAPTSHLLTSW